MEFSEGWGWDEEYGDEREWGDESWASEIDDFLDCARIIYDEGDFLKTKILYEEIFSILDMHEEAGYLPGPPDPLSLLTTDVKEAQFTLIRLKYLTSDPSDRISVMNEEAMQNPYLWNSTGFLEGVIGTDTAPLPEFEQFLKEWIDLMRGNISAKGDMLLREAVRIDGGIQAIEQYAFELGSKRPGFWRDLLEALANNKKIERTAELSQKALDIVDPDYTIRSEISDFLALAAKSLDDDELLLKAIRNGFHSSPDLDRLVSLALEANRQNCFKTEIDKACKRVEALCQREFKHTWDAESAMGSKTYADKNILVWSLIFANRFDEAIKLCSNEKPVGWTYSSSGIVVPFMLLFLAREKTQNLMEPLESAISFMMESDLKSILKSLDEVMQIRLPPETETEIFNWCVERVSNRITEIVSNKYRKSYYKAAMLAAGVAEVMSEMQNEKASAEFLMKWKETFNRHSAFRKELRKYAKRSKIASVSNISSRL
ncbi:MAG: hypothetical protein K8S14_07385 [Actinomycetia bacterium]|nr:hypothetical protein [Actinomycetes bacterium]